MPSENPFWFGWYPGDKPLNKRPVYPKATPPADFYDISISSALDAAWYEAEKIVSFPANMPRWVLDNVVDDFKSSFRISAVPYRSSGSDIYEFDAQESADVPGVRLEIDLYTLATDPKKGAQRMLQNTTNPLNPLKGEFWTDLETSVQRDMWRAFLKDTQPALMPVGYSWFTGAYSARGASPFDFSSVGLVDTVKRPMNMFTAGGADVVGMVEQEVDVYKELASSIVNFQTKKKSRITRGGAFDDMEQSFIQTTATELGQKRAQLAVAIPTSAPSVDNFLSESQIVLGRDVGGVRKGALGGISSSFSAGNKVLGKSSLTGSVVTADITTAFSKFTAPNGNITAIRENIDLVRATLPASEIASFDRRISGVESLLTDFESFSTQVAGMTNITQVQAEVLRVQLGDFEKRFSTTVYGGGLKSGYLSGFGRKHFGQEGLLDLAPNAPGILTPSYSSLGGLYRESRRDYLKYEASDLLTIVEKGKIQNTYLWNERLKRKAQVLTPAYWTGELIKRTHSFGLVYDEKYDGYKTLNKFSPFLKENKFNLEVPSLGGGSTRVALTGGKHLERLSGAWTAASSSNFVSAGTHAAGAFGAADILRDNHEAFLHALNGNPGANLQNAGRAAEYIFGSRAGDMQQLLLDSVQFKNLLIANAASLGLRLDGGNVSTQAADLDHNIQILNHLFTSLQNRQHNPAYYSAFASHIGRLQSFSSYLSRLQQGIYTKLGLRKIIAPYVYAKEAVVKKATDFVMQNVAKKVGAKLVNNAIATALSQALAVGTAGIGEIIAPIVERLVQAILAKLEKIGGKIIKAVFKGELVKTIQDMFDDALNKTGKVFGCGCMFPIVTAGLVFFLMGNLLSVISPVDFSSPAPATAGVGSGSGSTTPPIAPPPPIPLGTPGCFFRNTCERLICGSFPTCHGNDAYWAGGTACAWNIPVVYIYPPLGVRRTNQSGYICSSPITGSQYYGYASDYSNICPGDRNVYVPGFDSVTKWRVTGTFRSPNVGYGVTLTNSEGGSRRYRLLMLHMNNAGWVTGSEYAVGAGIGTLATGPGWATHIHIELSQSQGVRYIPIKPETLFSAVCEDTP